MRALNYAFHRQAFGLGLLPVVFFFLNISCSHRPTEEEWLTEVLNKSSLQADPTRWCKTHQRLLDRGSTKFVLWSYFRDKVNADCGVGGLVPVSKAPRVSEERDLWARYYQYRKDQDYEKALTTLDEMLSNLPLPWQTEVRLKEEKARTLKVMNKKEEAAKELESLSEWIARIALLYPDDRAALEQDQRLGLLAVRALWTLNQHQLARSLLKKLYRRQTKTPLRIPRHLAEILWLEARMREEEGQLRVARAKLDEAIRLQGIDTEFIRDRDFEIKLGWTAAWISYKMGQFDLAAEELKALAEKAPSPFEKSKFLYWAGQCYLSLGLAHLESAQALFREAYDTNYLGYYALLAAVALNGNVNKTESESTTAGPAAATGSDKFPSHRDLLAIDILLKYGESDRAIYHADKISNQWMEARPDTLFPESHFNLLSRLNHYLPLVRLLAKAEGPLRHKWLSEKLDWFFPKPFEEFARQASNRFGVPLSLIYAIIRQESAFNPRARSHADAMGLMQMLPRIATRIAQAQGIAFKSPSDLFNPETNILIGTAFLKELLDSNNGDWIATIAQYNASKEAYQNWIANRFRSRSAEFIEEVPYEETQTYLKLVLRNANVYGKLFGENQASLWFQRL